MLVKRVLVDCDRHDALELPSGELAARLRLGDLRAQLQRLKIDGIAPPMGRAELLDCYAAQVNRVAEELRPPNQKRILPLPLTAMREAVAFIERQASA